MLFVPPLTNPFHLNYNSRRNFKYHYVKVKENVLKNIEAGYKDELEVVIREKDSFCMFRN